MINICKIYCLWKIVIMTLHYGEYQTFLCLFVNEGFVDTLLFLDFWSGQYCFYFEV